MRTVSGRCAAVWAPAARTRFGTACTLWGLVALLSMGPAAHAVFNYTTNDGVIAIIGYAGADTDIAIPELMEGLSVTSIGDFAFANLPSLVSLSVPSLVTNIGDAAFYNCASLTNVTLPAGVTRIGNAAMSHCVSLAGVTLPAGITRIGHQTFDYCSSLDSVTIPEGMEDIGEEAFRSCTSLTRIQIPDTVTHIGDSAFSWCANLATVGLGAGVTHIGAAAFAACTSLASITLPAGITNIEAAAFSDCASLTAVYCRGAAPEIEETAFAGADGVVVYYLRGTGVWGATVGGRPTAWWTPRIQGLAAGAGMGTNAFAFSIAWASGQVAVVDACPDIALAAWIPLHTNTFVADHVAYRDVTWNSAATRFYRLRAP